MHLVSSWQCMLDTTVLTSFFFSFSGDHRDLHSFPTRRSSDLASAPCSFPSQPHLPAAPVRLAVSVRDGRRRLRSEEHTSELQSRQYLVCRLLLEKKKFALRQASARDLDRHLGRRYCRGPLRTL